MRISEILQAVEITSNVKERYNPLYDNVLVQMRFHFKDAEKSPPYSWMLYPMPMK